MYTVVGLALIAVFPPAGSLVNVEVYLFQRGTLDPVPCDFANPVRLRWARNWTAGRPPYGGLTPSHHAVEQDILGRAIPEGAVGQLSRRQVDDKAFPFWTFNDVPVVRLADLRIKTFYFVEVDDVDTRTNIWAHAEDPRTFLPNPLLPQAVTGTDDLDVFDAMIQVVYPHDRQGRLQPVARAPLVNIAVDLFKHPVPFEFQAAPLPTAAGWGRARSVWLLRSLNDGYLERVKRFDEVIGEKRYEPRLDWSRWVFNDVDVAATSDPANKYYFAVQVEGVTTHTTIWAHGADSRTYFPERDVPTSSSAACS